MVVSEPKFGIKSEKERHIFCFDKALLFTRKVEVPQTSNFKYETKAKIPVRSVVCVCVCVWCVCVCGVFVCLFVHVCVRACM